MFKRFGSAALALLLCVMANAAFAQAQNYPVRPIRLIVPYAAGGNAGTITLDAGGATPTITLAGNLTATGGNRVGTGTAGNGVQVWAKDAVLLNAATVTVDARGGSAGVGTGGTATGVGRYLKEKNPAIKVWGIDTYGSIFKKYKETGVFDKNEIYPYITEGIGEDFLPKNVDFDVIDHFMNVRWGARWRARSTIARFVLPVSVTIAGCRTLSANSSRRA